MNNGVRYFISQTSFNEGDTFLFLSDQEDFEIPWFCRKTDKRRFVEQEISKEYILELFPLLKWTKYK